MKEKIGKIFKDYGSLLSLATISVAGFIRVSPGDAAKGLGEALSTIELDELRTRIEKLLAESGKRVALEWPRSEKAKLNKRETSQGVNSSGEDL